MKPSTTHAHDGHPLACVVPQCARTVLHVGCGAGTLGRSLRASRGIDVYGIESDPALAVRARTELTDVIEYGSPANGLPFPEGFFDCIIVDRLPPGTPGLEPALRRLAPLLAAEGMLLVLTRYRGYWRVRAGLDPAPTVSPGSAMEAVAAVGLVPFGSRTVQDTETAIEAGDGRRFRVGDHEIELASGEMSESLQAFGGIVIAVSADYNPVLHARRLFDEGHPDWAHEILGLIPKPYLQNTEVSAAVAAEMQLCILATDTKAGPAGRLSRFWDAQVLFYRAVAYRPEDPGPYQCQAEFWRRLGDADMAARLLRSIQRIAHCDSVANQLAGYGDPPDRPAVEYAGEGAPEWTPEADAPRVLLITHPRPHYELDVLYDGLCRLLGEERVTEFPWKGTLHGERPAELGHYPCTFNRRGERLELNDLLNRLRGGQFDVILFGDIEGSMPRDKARAIAGAAGLPLFVIDTEDDPADHRDAVAEYLGRKASAYFKREMLACVDYGPAAFPLPFAYPDDRIPDEVPWEGRQGLFWAGNRSFGLRRLYLERLESVLGGKLDALYAQEDYVRGLQACQVGLNLFGLGFDTVRYWELPAHGCLLLSERLPIRVPHDFRDGESAVFFDDVAGLEERLSSLFEHPDECAAIARAGHEHVKRYHTGSARAGQLLARIREVTRT
ncbi:MAG: glycosyltransferase [Candidatus Hydrogenedentes bacterium]|nr:glycosyltransferase [Candidatus Hydrogenedentota bacterium]